MGNNIFVCLFDMFTNLKGYDNFKMVFKNDRFIRMKCKMSILVRQIRNAKIILKVSFCQMGAQAIHSI